MEKVEDIEKVENIKTIEPKLINLTVNQTFEFWRTELSSRDSLNTLDLKGYWEVVWKDLEGKEIKREKNLDNPLQFSFNDVEDFAVLQGFLTVTNYMKEKLVIHLNPVAEEPLKE